MNRSQAVQLLTVQLVFPHSIYLSLFSQRAMLVTNVENWNLSLRVYILECEWLLGRTVLSGALTSSELRALHGMVCFLNLPVLLSFRLSVSECTLQRRDRTTQRRETERATDREPRVYRNLNKAFCRCDYEALTRHSTLLLLI